jgi:hypothetical protein
MKEIVLPLVSGLLLFFFVCFFFQLMDFFRKKRLWAALNLIFQEKLDDEEVLENISTETLIKYESILRKGVYLPFYNELISKSFVLVCKELFKRN